MHVANPDSYNHWEGGQTRNVHYLPIPEFGAQGEEVAFRGCLRCVQPEERVVLHARLPQVFAAPITDHVESYQVLDVVIL